MNNTALIGLLLALPGRWLLRPLFCSIVFVSGFVMGQRNVRQAWNAEQLQQKSQTLQQALHVSQIQTQQERINLKITADYEAQKSQLARRAPVLHDGAHCLYNSNSITSDTVPTHARLATSTQVTPANPVPDHTQHTDAISCEQLVSDAANTTLMVLSFQRWYLEHARHWLQPNEDPKAISSTPSNPTIAVGDFHAEN